MRIKASEELVIETPSEAPSEAPSSKSFYWTSKPMHDGEQKNRRFTSELLSILVHKRVPSDYFIFHSKICVFLRTRGGPLATSIGFFIVLISSR